MTPSAPYRARTRSRAAWTTCRSTTGRLNSPATTAFARSSPRSRPCAASTSCARSVNCPINTSSANRGASGNVRSGLGAGTWWRAPGTSAAPVGSDSMFRLHAAPLDLHQNHETRCRARSATLLTAQPDQPQPVRSDPFPAVAARLPRAPRSAVRADHPAQRRPRVWLPHRAEPGPPAPTCSAATRRPDPALADSARIALDDLGRHVAVTPGDQRAAMGAERVGAGTPAVRCTGRPGGSAKSSVLRSTPIPPSDAANHGHPGSGSESCPPTLPHIGTETGTPDNGTSGRCRPGWASPTVAHPVHRRPAGVPGVSVVAGTVRLVRCGVRRVGWAGRCGRCAGR